MLLPEVTERGVCRQIPGHAVPEGPGSGSSPGPGGFHGILGSSPLVLGRLRHSWKSVPRLQRRWFPILKSRSATRASPRPLAVAHVPGVTGSRWKKKPGQREVWEARGCLLTRRLMGPPLCGIILRNLGAHGWWPGAGLRIRCWLVLEARGVGWGGRDGSDWKGDWRVVGGWKQGRLGSALGKRC